MKEDKRKSVRAQLPQSRSEVTEAIQTLQYALCNQLEVWLQKEPDNICFYKELWKYLSNFVSLFLVITHHLTNQTRMIKKKMNK